MTNLRWIGLALVMVIGLVPLGALADTYVTAPMVIEQPGTYVLTNDILNYNGTRFINGTEYYQPCFVILSSDVIFNGNGHHISGDPSVHDATRNDQIGTYVDVGLERVTVRNLNVDGGFNYGIQYTNIGGGQIESNDVTGNDVGIDILASNNLAVVGNNAHDNNINGINLTESDQNTLDGNLATGNQLNGIYLEESGFSDARNTLINNIANSNSGNGIKLYLSHYNDLQNNTAKNNVANGILLNSSGDPFTEPYLSNNLSYNDVENNQMNGISLEGETSNPSANNIIFQNTAKNNAEDGIHLTITSESNSVTGNTASGNQAGIGLSGSLDNNISDNTVTGNVEGIKLGFADDLTTSDDNVITNNTAFGNSESGIDLEGPDYFNPVILNEVTLNRVFNNPVGIELDPAWSNTITDNLIYSNSNIGLHLNASQNNVIYNNMFNNTVNAAFGTMINENTWNVLHQPGPNIVDGKYKGGNFWAKPDGTGPSQTGIDVNGDGFAEAQYAVAYSNIDYFPLINPLKANFTASPPFGSKPLTVTFMDNSTGDATIPPGTTTWLWDFGDGNTSTLQNPTHTYYVEGAYNVTLLVTNNGGSSTTKPPCNCTTGFQVIVGIQAPVADFTTCAPCGPRYGTFPLVVTFKDLSTGSDPRSYLWDFGDGSNSTLQNPVHIFTIARNYTVSLTVTNPAGSNTTTKIDYITTAHTPAPVADFSASPQSGTNPLVVVFTDQSTGSLPLSYVWDFGDGTPNDFVKNPVHTYNATGTYSVTLTVTNPGGSSTITHPNMIGVNLPPAPIAEFTAVPWSGTAPLTVNFVDQSTQSPTQWQWDFGDGSTGPERFQKNPTHTYSTPNSYTVSLIATGTGGSSSPRSHTVLVNPPSSLVASFNAAPVTGIMPLTVQFLDTSTGSPTSWQWSFGDGSTSSLQSPNHVYSNPGKYTVSLTISNAQGSNTVMMSDFIYVRNTPPTADFSGTPLSGPAPLSVQFTDQSTGNAITQWHWDFGDGSTTTGANNAPIHVYQAQGIYTVALVATNDGGSSTESKPAYVNVSNVVPTANFLASPMSGPVPLNVQFTDQSTGSGLNYFWQFGDGQVSTIQNPSHTFSTSGLFNVNLTVSNGGGTSSTIKTIFTNSPDANNISLSAGWNFISVPKVLATGSNTGAIFGNVNTGGHSIWQYDAASQTWTRVTPTTLVQPLFGYWIFSTTPTVVPLTFSTDPTQVPPTRQLATGWNAIGFTGVNPASSHDTFVSVNTSWTQSMGFIASSQVYDTQIIHGGSGQFSDSRLLFPTDGYWLYMTSPGTLSAIGG